MPQSTISELRLLDHCVTDRSSLQWIRDLLERIEKCCQAVDSKVNLGDIVADGANRESLSRLFGPEGYEVGLQLLLKLALKDHHSMSFTVHEDLEGAHKFEFLHRSVAAWKQFDMIVQVSGPQGLVFNPKRQEHWKQIESIKAGSLVTVHIKATQGRRVHAEEILAVQRFVAVFVTVQTQREAMEPAAVAAPKPAPTTGVKPPPFRRPLRRTPAFTTAGPPVMELSVKVNKVDTFIHAGNAHLIVNLIKDYQGKVLLYVMRGAKKKVSLDADSIWSAEIRNGETVLFEFFGPQPSPHFLKELARGVNKYTQMDKVANE